VQGLTRDTLVDGRYQILDRIGSGGMGDVYRAHDNELERVVALKLLLRRFSEDPEFVARFRREASAAAGLQHPNIVQIFDRGEWDGTYYIAMEYLPGRTLKQIVREHGPLEPARAIEVLEQILMAARFAHERGIVHRDIKPHNVIVAEDGRVKVTDFGIALAGASDMTETGSIMGTAQYLSPEQAQGHPVDARSDLYSIGIVLYELLTGTVPFDADSPVTIALKQVSEVPVPPGQLNPAVPPALDSVVMRALQKDPAARFQSAEEFLAALEQARLGFPAAPPPEAVVEEDDGWRRATIIALVLLAVAAIALGAWLLLRGDKEPVPNVVGKTSASAAQVLQNQGFEVDVVPIQSDSVADGRVAGQQPEPGEEAKKGSTVSITVSSGPGESTIPAVKGMPADQAASQLQSAGFKTAQRRQYSGSVASGQVIETDPPEGTNAQKGSTVTLVVSRGQQAVGVPNVVGRDRDDAESALRNAGFKVDASQRENDDADPGSVLSQDPAGGSQATKGSTVKIVVAKAPPQVEVPDVTGLTEGEARNSLQDAGLRVRTRTDTVSAEDQDGVVLSQQPNAGNNAGEGDTVTLVIGQFQATPTPTPTPTP
jgi:eukaryotic-like serine/threonine-protein kinase